MRISIFGGTGPTGLLLVQQALAHGHDVVAFARTPSKLRPHAKLSLIGGHLDDAEKISAAIAGSDAVVSVLGPGTNAADAPPLVTGTRNIVTAMHQHGVRRLVATGTPSMTDPADSKDWKIGLLVKMIRRFQPAAYDAIVSIDRIIRESGLDWTIVRLPFLSDGPLTSDVNAHHVGEKGGLRLSRANAAAYLLDRATDTSQLHDAPFITDK